MRAGRRVCLQGADGMQHLSSKGMQHAFWQAGRRAGRRASIMQAGRCRQYVLSGLHAECVLAGGCACRALQAVCAE
jgi:hypothetical protein